MVHPEEHGEQSPEQSNDSPTQSSDNVDDLSNINLPSVSSDRPMKQELEESTTGTPETSEQECERGSDGSDSSPNPTSPKRARMLDKLDSETVASDTNENVLSQTEVPDIATQYEDTRTSTQKQELEESTAGKPETSEQECERGSDGSDSSPNPTSPKRARTSEKFDVEKVDSDTKANILSQPEVPDTAAEHEDPQTIHQKQELEESTAVKHETSEQECERESNGSDSSPNPTSPKIARMAEKLEHEDSQTTPQDQESAESTKLGETGISPGCSKSEPCAHDDPHGPPKQVENAQENPCPVLASNFPINNQDHPDNVPLLGPEAHEIPFVEPEPIEPQDQEVHEIIDNDGHQQYFPASPMIMSDKNIVFTNTLYECPRCEILFGYPVLFLLHMISHRRNSPICGCWFVCACERHYHINKIGFNAHLLMAAHDFNAYEEEEFVGADGLPTPIGDERKAFWKQSVVYWCRYCCIMYLHQIMQRFHVINHNAPPPLQYVCRQCHLNCEDKNTFNLHLFDVPHVIPPDVLL